MPTNKTAEEKCVLCGMLTGRFWVGVRSKTNKNAVLCTWCIRDIRPPNFMNSLYGDINPNFEFITPKAKGVNRKYYKLYKFIKEGKKEYLRNTRGID